MAMFSVHERRVGPGLLLAMLMLGSPGQGGATGQEAKDGQPAAETRDKDAVRTTGPADPRSVWYTVGNLSVDLLTRAWGSPIVELMRKVQPPPGAHAEGADHRARSVSSSNRWAVGSRN